MDVSERSGKDALFCTKHGKHFLPEENCKECEHHAVVFVAPGGLLRQAHFWSDSRKQFRKRFVDGKDAEKVKFLIRANADS